MKRRILETLITGLFFVLQCTLFNAIALAGIRPNLMLFLTSAFGFMKGRKEGMYVGFFAGILTDILFGNGLIGFYMLLYVWIGYGNGLFTRLFYPEDMKLPLILIAISDLLFNFASYVLTFLLRARLSLGYFSLHVILPELLYTLLLSAVLYRPLQKLEVFLEVGEDSREERENA